MFSIGLGHDLIGILKFGLLISVTIQYYSKKSSFSNSLVKISPRFIIRLTFESVNFVHLLSFHLFVASPTFWMKHPLPISSFTYRRSWIRLNSSILKGSKIRLLGHFWLPFPPGCSAKSSFVMESCHWTF